jgi:hypothetical protein
VPLAAHSRLVPASLVARALLCGGSCALHGQTGKFGFSFEEAQAAMCAALTDAVGAECPLQDGQGGRSGAASSSADVQQ